MSTQGCSLTTLDVAQPCVRELLAALIPFAYVVACLLAPVIHRLFPSFVGLFTQWITVEEARDTLSKGDTKGAGRSEETRPLAGVTTIWILIALSETAVWMAVGSYNAFLGNPFAFRYFVFVACWLFASLNTGRDTSFPWMQLMVLYAMLFVSSVYLLASELYFGLIYEHSIPRVFDLVGYGLNVAATAILVLSSLRSPFNSQPKSMSDTKEELNGEVNQSPEDSVTVWGWMTFNWATALISEGTRRTLNEVDIYELSLSMRAWPLFEKFRNLHPEKSLLWRLFRANSQDLILDFLGTIVSVLCNYSTPFFLKYLLDEISSGYPDGRTRAYVYAFLLFAFKVCKSETDLQRLWCGRRAAIRMRSEMMSLVFMKALKRKDIKIISKKVANAIDTENFDPADTGKVMNLMSQDTSRISTAVSTMSMLYSAPFEIVIAVTFLSQLMGVAVVAGLGILVICLPLNAVLAAQSLRVKRSYLAARDGRMNVLNELLAAIKLVKFFAWEERWADKVLERRALELVILAKYRVIKVLLELLWAAVPLGIANLTFYAYVAQGNELSLGTTFAALALFGMLRTPLNTISTRIMEIIQAYVSLKRIEAFIGEEDVDYRASSLLENNGDATYAKDLDLKDASFTWNRPKDATGEESVKDRIFCLKDVSIAFPSGRLSVVTGPTASGKTALLLAILGEMTALPGTIPPYFKNADEVEEVNGLRHSVSYAAQTSWLQHQSIKNNILFGTEYEEDRYKAVIDACALLRDFEILEDADETEIGTRGVMLSGGQKARVALARAVYAKSKYVLLDDPLSAVDALTAKQLVEILFSGPLMKDRTVILVTHHVELVLPVAAYIVHMKDGRVDTQGPVEDLRAAGTLDEVIKDAEETAVDGHQVEQDENDIDAQDLATSSKVPVEEDKHKPRELVKKEHREEGRVKYNVYTTYLKASSGWPFAIVLLMIILQYALNVGEKFWIKVWTEAYERSAELFFIDHLHHPPSYIPGLFTFYLHSKPRTGELPAADEDPFFFVGVYALIGLGQLLALVISSSMTYTAAFIASRRLFRRLLMSVTQATMHWYDTTPVGRVMNRFTKDIDTCDGSLSTYIQHVSMSFIGLCMSVGVVVAVFPVFIFPAIFLGYFYYVIGNAYLKTGRDLRRMESTTRSPIFAFFDELLDGVVTVRAFSAEKWFLETICTKLDLTLKMNYMYWVTNRWLLLRFDCLGTVAILVTSILSISSNYSQVAGWAALCITSALTFTNQCYWLCRNYTALELDLNSAERVIEYLDIPHEQPGVIENARPPAHWPSSSGPNADKLLEVEKLEIKYAPDLPSVLHQVSFTFKAGERVGVIGRTGSGKSTLAMSLLRFVEPIGGKVKIDGVDISSIGVRDLRSRVTFVPQDACLFAGTVRENLDPFGEFDDAMCWDSLKRVHLVSETSPLPSPGQSRERNVSRSSGTDLDGSDASGAISLDTDVSAGGLNFSVGQRQLLALARAILRRSAIVILDEATSCIDFETDDKIQRTIREEFSNELLISIAHRLNTIIDYDRLLVLDAGRVAELDSPLNLISKEGGIFRELCLNSGKFEELERIAKTKATGQY